MFGGGAGGADKEEGKSTTGLEERDRDRPTKGPQKGRNFSGSFHRHSTVLTVALEAHHVHTATGKIYQVEATFLTLSNGSLSPRDQISRLRIRSRIVRERVK